MKTPILDENNFSILGWDDEIKSSHIIKERDLNFLEQLRKDMDQEKMADIEFWLDGFGVSYPYNYHLTSFKRGINLFEDLNAHRPEFEDEEIGEEESEENKHCKRAWSWRLPLPESHPKYDYSHEILFYYIDEYLYLSCECVT